MPWLAPLAGVPLALAGDAAAAPEARSWLAFGAWFLGAWVVISVVSALFLSRWLRARARANERLSAEIRREDWAAAAGAAAAEGDRPGEPRRR